MLKTAFTIRAVLTGQVAPLAGNGTRSAIAKQPLDRPVRVGPTGLEGDEQADTRHHGGPEKAVHHYPFDSYEFWRGALPDGVPHLDRPGGFGENLSTLGVTEADLCIGDVWRAGTALLQVSQARQPCWKLNRRFGVPDMARRVQQSGRTGWYYRVLEAGTIAPGDAFILEGRPQPDWPLARLLRVLYVDRLDRPSLAAMAALPELAQGWRAIASRRLETGAVENWSARLGER